MKENIVTLEKSKELYTSSKLFNSLPPEYKLIQLKILNGQELSQEEKNDYNDATDEEACKLIREIKIRISEVRESLIPLHRRKLDNKELSLFVALSNELYQLHRDKKSIVDETDQLLIL